MQLQQILVISSIFSEWIIYLPATSSPLRVFWQKKSAICMTSLFISLLLIILLLPNVSNVWAFLIIIMSLFRIINLARIIKGRMNEHYLKMVTRHTGIILGLSILFMLLLYKFIPVGWSRTFNFLTIITLLLSILLITSVIKNIQKTKYRPVLKNYADRELPTVTVAIPARNETPELEACLRSIIACDYPKFEILVLDDCSSDRTPEIIRSFAHDGVRFIKGDDPNPNWLAKNQAYDKLADSATGEIIIFCGVDVRLGKYAIRALVSTLLSRKKQMISVLPTRYHAGSTVPIIQPMRYWWELALPRRLFNRPAVLSTCWMIKRRILFDHGGFEAVHRAIIPEGYFARETIKDDGYTFIRADNLLDVQSTKSTNDQLDTAVRVRYPQLKHKLEWTMTAFFIEVLLFVFPILMLVSGIWMGLTFVQISSVITLIITILGHFMILKVTNPKKILIGLISWPIVITTELYIGLLSMYKYEFSEVIWKDRNICEPVMHTIPKLPPTDG